MGTMLCPLPGRRDLSLEQLLHTQRHRPLSGYSLILLAGRRQAALLKTGSQASENQTAVGNSKLPAIDRRASVTPRW